jgi:hypothetical protein
VFYGVVVPPVVDSTVITSVGLVFVTSVVLISKVVVTAGEVSVAVAPVDLISTVVTSAGLVTPMVVSEDLVSVIVAKVVLVSAMVASEGFFVRKSSVEQQHLPGGGARPNGQAIPQRTSRQS